MLDRTGVRCKVLGRIVVRCEIQIGLGYSWFSAKFVLANRSYIVICRYSTEYLIFFYKEGVLIAFISGI